MFQVPLFDQKPQLCRSHPTPYTKCAVVVCSGNVVMYSGSVVVITFNYDGFKSAVGTIMLQVLVTAQGLPEQHLA